MPVMPVMPVRPPSASDGDRLRDRKPHPSEDEIAASAIEGRAEMPDWQSAFTLSPNVRFTRTPEAALTRRPLPDPRQQQLLEHGSAEEAGDKAAHDQPQTPAGPDLGSGPVQANGQPGEAAPQELPRHIQPLGARAITYRLKQEFAATRQERIQAGEGALQAPVAPIPVPASVSRLAMLEQMLARQAQAGLDRKGALPLQEKFGQAPFLSDHAFWEAVHLDGTAEPPAPETDDSPDTAARNRAIVEALRSQFAAAERANEAARAAAVPPLPAVEAASTPITSAHLAPLADLPELRRYPVDDGSITALYHAVAVRETNMQALPATPVPGEADVTVGPARGDHVEGHHAAPAEPAPVPAAAPVRARITARAPLLQPFSNPLGLGPAGEAEYELPPVDLLQVPVLQETTAMTPEVLEQSAGLLESVLEDFGIKGEIIDVRPGPVVTLYEFEPAPGVKSSRVIGLSDDIARSMSALSARVAVVPGRNVIGIELPNPVRETVYFRELIESADYTQSRFHLPVCLGKTIGGEPVIAELSKMPHLLVAGTTGSGKSVAINTMILSLLYRLKPEECRLIMVDPKMLELSVYDGIPHLLTPVVTDPKKAVMALKWAVREMEERYKKMSRLGVRNIDGYNTRAGAARAKGETILCSVQTGFDRATGEVIYEQEEMDLTAMPYIVVIVDEMADLMMVAGKEIEGAIQRLAQMARAAGIHLIMATQRPSVDVITGTIKANFPTRISFQVTSKIDSRTILGEPGAEHLLGQGDMLHMIGGGRIARVHGPFVSDEEVEKVVAHLKTQGRPEYLGTVTEDADEVDEVAEEDNAVFDKSAMGEEDANDVYEKAVKLVLRDKKCSTSYIQRRLGIGYNRAASLVERMEQEGLVGPANHVGKRAILAGGRDLHDIPCAEGDD